MEFLFTNFDWSYVMVRCIGGLTVLHCYPPHRSSNRLCTQVFRPVFFCNYGNLIVVSDEFFRSRIFKDCRPAYLTWTVLGSNPGDGEIFRNHPERTWLPASLLYNAYRLFFPGLKRPGRNVDHPPSI